MERRAYATIKKQWPEVSVTVSSPQISYTGYPNEEISKDDCINIMVGDLQRIIEYPKLGYQIEQNIPKEVMSAFEELVALGYTEHLSPKQIRNR